MNFYEYLLLLYHFYVEETIQLGLKNSLVVLEFRYVVMYLGSWYAAGYC